MLTNRMELYVNVNKHLYSPKGFMNNPLYSSYFQGMTPSERTEVLNGFVRYLAITMRKMLKNSIKDQYYKRYWEPLNPKYVEFKREHGLSGNIWEATGKLVNSISYRKQGGRYVVGIDPSATYPDGTSVLFIARCMEFGTKNMPARPLFNPVVKYIRRNVHLYWQMYMLNPSRYTASRVASKLKKNSRKRR